MVKVPFNTRMDADVIALAKKVAKRERRSVTNVFEFALTDYAERHGIMLNGSDEVETPPAPKFE